MAHSRTLRSLLVLVAVALGGACHRGDPASAGPAAPPPMGVGTIVLQQVEDSNIEFFPNLITHRRRLVEYIASRQVDEAKREMTEHLQRLRRHLMRAERTAADNRATSALAEESSL